MGPLSGEATLSISLLPLPSFVMMMEIIIIIINGVPHGPYMTIRLDNNFNALIITTGGEGYCDDCYYYYHHNHDSNSTTITQ